MRRFLKFLHTMGSLGYAGALAALLVMMSRLPAPSALDGYALIRGTMSAVATWLLFPSVALVLLAGLVSMAVTRAYHNAGWVWLKLLTGVLVFEGTFVGVLGPMQVEAEQSAAALAGRVDRATLGASLGAEQGTLWLLLAVATANVVLGIWRPRLTRIPD
ncbi:hypothetical protein [Salinarimonas soli]|uniref:DUF2269 family protein n=1 Tax=Salinarimonas soli TaxID=1638099 RepID=A0A5B2VHA2_9HYPH|nr:hypothetical protein [Salinarimonas soli]KAA2238274.1 hypothetical protein F0L46_06410 [Salinarimonas soli]